MKSMTFYPIFHCLKLFEENFADGNNEWVSCNDKQNKLLRVYHQYVNELKELKDCLEGIADLDISKVNAWLRERGFDIQLSEDIPDTFAVASVLKLFIKWLEPGEETEIIKEGIKYPAAKVSKGFDCFSYGPHEIFKLYAEDNIKVFMMPCDLEFEDEFKILDFIQAINGWVARFNPLHVDTLTFPKINFQEIIRLDYILQMRVDIPHAEYPLRIIEALQQNFFKMDHLGAEVKSGTAMLGWSGYSYNYVDYVLDRRFLLWVMKDGMSIPAFIGIFDKDYWKE
jgi:hypothetical protein